MHVAFIAYGIKEAVDKLYREMEAQKFPLPMTCGTEKRTVWINGNLRVLPFGVIEYSFPKEQKDVVLSTLDFDKPQRYGYYGWKFYVPIFTIRKALSLKSPGKFDNKHKLLWLRDNVNFIPLGVRDDIDISMTKDEEGKTWTHEGI